MKYHLLALCMGLLIPISGYTADGDKIFSETCASCHKMTAIDHSQMVAPPVFAIQNHYLDVHQGKRNFVQAVAMWIANPDPNRALMPGAIRRFGLMPAQSLSAEDRIAVAEFLYEVGAQKPPGYDEHFRQEHGHSPKQRQ